MCILLPIIAAHNEGCYLTGMVVTFEGVGQQLLPAHCASRAGRKRVEADIAPNDKGRCAGGTLCATEEKESITVHLRKPSRDKCRHSGLAVTTGPEVACSLSRVLS